MIDRTGPHGVRRGCLLILAVALSTAAAPQAHAQIVNTLRAGWREEANGWSGSVLATISLAEGNVKYFMLDAGAAIQFQTERHRIRLLGHAGRTTAGGTEISKDFMGHLRHNYRILPWLSSLAFLQAQYDLFRRIQNRLLLGLGARFDLVNAETFDLSLGASYMREIENVIDDGEGAIGYDRASLFAVAYGRLAPVRIDLSSFYQPLLGDPADWRTIVVASFRIDLIGELDYLLGFTFRYDSEPPDGVKETDLRLRTGLQFDF